MDKQASFAGELPMGRADEAPVGAKLGPSKSRRHGALPVAVQKVLSSGQAHIRLRGHRGKYFSVCVR